MIYKDDMAGWLKNNHPQVLEEWLLYTKPQRDLEAKRIKEKFDEIQRWLNTMEDHPRWKRQDDWIKAIQTTLDLYYEDPDDEEQRTTYWNAIRSLASSHPSSPFRRYVPHKNGYAGEEE